MKLILIIMQVKNAPLLYLKSLGYMPKSWKYKILSPYN